MGLAIIAYKQMKLIPKTTDRREWFMRLRADQRHVYIDKETIDDTEKDYPGRTAGLFAGIYSWTTGHSFGITYGGFNDWRRDLAKFAGTTYDDVIANRQPVGTPFVELINFYDNGGVLGPVVSAKLAADFVDNADKYSDWLRENGDDDDYSDATFDDLQVYMDWSIALIFAGDNGAVQFG